MGAGEEIHKRKLGIRGSAPDRVTILANDALKPEEIDVERARQQVDCGMKMWNDAGEKRGTPANVIAEAEAKLAAAEEK